MHKDADLLLDVDVFVFSAGWAGSERLYVMRGKEFKYKKEALKFGPEEELQQVVNAAPLDHVLHNVRQAMDTVLESLAPVNSYQGYLTGKGNFREKIATIQPYKGNRSPDAKPPHYGEIRQYLQDVYNCQVVEGMEADDKIAMEYTKALQEGKNCIVVGVDKDYLQIPHLKIYNPHTKEMKQVTPLEAHLAFYGQLLTGDTVDHIPGVKGIGPAKRDKLLQNQICPIQMERICYLEYQRAYGPKAWDYMVENAKLLYLLRHEKDEWKPRVDK